MVGGIGNGGITGIGGSFQKPDPEEMFNKLDTNGDGKVSKDELTSAISQISEKTGSSFNVDDIFTKSDTDQDGEISKDEYMAAVKKMEANRAKMQGMGGQQMNPQEMFKKIDTNGDGSISKDEFKTFSAKMDEKTGKTTDSDQTFDVMDTNQDGVVSADEYAAYMEKVAEKMRAEAGGSDKVQSAQQTTAAALMPLLDNMGTSDNADKIAKYLENAVDQTLSSTVKVNT